MNELSTLNQILVTLYLKRSVHAPRRTRRSWLGIASLIRKLEPPISEVPVVLRKYGFWEEALALQDQDALNWSLDVLSRGQCLVATDANYPALWLRRLGRSAPPVLWKSGNLPNSRFISAVGCRNPRRESALAADRIGAQIAISGYAVLSGNARGCDQIAQEAALREGGRAVSILPHGINLALQKSERQVFLSLCAPDEEFDRGAAMERNNLIYAGSIATVVIDARPMTGGTWHGASSALRKRLCPVLVLATTNPRAAFALKNLGAQPMSAPDDLIHAIKRKPHPNLFSVAG